MKQALKIRLSVQYTGFSAHVESQRDCSFPKFNVLLLLQGSRAQTDSLEFRQRASPVAWSRSPEQALCTQRITSAQLPLWGLGGGT